MAAGCGTTGHRAESKEQRVGSENQKSDGIESRVVRKVSGVGFRVSGTVRLDN
jgi:hypothetical protein